MRRISARYLKKRCFFTAYLNDKPIITFENIEELSLWSDYPVAILTRLYTKCGRKLINTVKDGKMYKIYRYKKR